MWGNVSGTLRNASGAQIAIITIYSVSGQDKFSGCPSFLLLSSGISNAMGGRNSDKDFNNGQ
jgi:hypothetical protein